MRSKKAILEDFEDLGPDSLTYLEDKDVAKVFVRALKETEIGQRIAAQDLWTPENLQYISDQAQQEAGPDFTFSDFVKTATELYNIGDLEKFVAPAEPEVERDVKGRVLSSKAKQWKRWQEFCNDSATKMETITALRKSNPAFAEFYRNQQAQEFRVDDPMAEVNAALNIKKPAGLYTVDPAVTAYAARYRTTRSEVLKAEMNPGTNVLGPQAAAEATRLFNAACAAGLI